MSLSPAEEKAWCAQRTESPLWLTVEGTRKETLEGQAGAGARQAVYAAIMRTGSVRLRDPTQSGGCPRVRLGGVGLIFGCINKMWNRGG